jgi:hypothetical protein
MARRNDIDLMSSTEKAIWEVKGRVEAMGAHPLLTDATVLLSQAQDKVADYLEMPAPHDRNFLERGNIVQINGVNIPVNKIDIVLEDGIEQIILHVAPTGT